MPLIHCLRQGDEEIGQIYCGDGYVCLTAGPAFATPDGTVKIYSAGSKQPGALEGTADDIKRLQQLQQLRLSPVAARVIGALLKRTTTGKDRLPHLRGKRF